MTPQQATEMQNQLLREMTPDRRLERECGLHQLACEMARGGIRMQHPHADEEEVERLLVDRIRLAWRPSTTT